jgi:hypothetical protein
MAVWCNHWGLTADSCKQHSIVCWCLAASCWLCTDVLLILLVILCPCWFCSHRHLILRPPLPGTSGYTPLHYAARAGQLKAVQLLLKHGEC